MWILGVNFGHEAGASLIKDGNIIASVLEEKFVRVKHYVGLPFNAVRFCLEYANLKEEDIDYITIPTLLINPNLKLFLGIKKNLFTHYSHHINKKSDLIKLKATAFLRKLFYGPATALPVYLKPFNFKDTKIINIEHHESHAASAYYTSGINDKCLIFTSDGAGDNTTLSIWIGENGKIKLLKRFGTDGSLGWFFGCITEALGWQANEGEGKTMGLAPYGDFNRLKNKLNSICPIYKDGDLYRGYKFSNVTVITYNNADHYHFDEAYSIKKLIEEYGRENVASEAQRMLEEMIYGLIEFYVKSTNIRNICCAGGTFMNIKVNQKIVYSGLVDKYWVFPSAGDGGLAIGSALRQYYLATKKYPNKKLESLSLGPKFESIPKLVEIQ